MCFGWMMKYAEVILPLPLRDSYTYCVPTDLESIVSIGSRVIVHFGKRRYYTAIVIDIRVIAFWQFSI